MAGLFNKTAKYDFSVLMIFFFIEQFIVISPFVLSTCSAFRLKTNQANYFLQQHFRCNSEEKFRTLSVFHREVYRRYGPFLLCNTVTQTLFSRALSTKLLGQNISSLILTTASSHSTHVSPISVLFHSSASQAGSLWLAGWLAGHYKTIPFLPARK